MRSREEFFKKHDFACDCSSPYREQFEEIPPYAKNPETGEILNDSPYPILKKVDDMNVQEYIDSFADEGDIYSLIAKYTASGIDTGLKPNQVMDTTQVPTEPGEILKYVQASDQLAEDNPEIAENLFDDKKLEEIINAKVAAALAKSENSVKVDTVANTEEVK